MCSDSVMELAKAIFEALKVLRPMFKERENVGMRRLIRCWMLLNPCIESTE
jgi:hypothetical protein